MIFQQTFVLICIVFVLFSLNALHKHCLFAHGFRKHSRKISSFVLNPSKYVVFNIFPNFSETDFKFILASLMNICNFILRNFWKFEFYFNAAVLRVFRFLIKTYTYLNWWNRYLSRNIFQDKRSSPNWIIIYVEKQFSQTIFTSTTSKLRILLIKIIHVFNWAQNALLK